MKYGYGVRCWVLREKTSVENDTSEGLMKAAEALRAAREAAARKEAEAREARFNEEALRRIAVGIRKAASHGATWISVHPSHVQQAVARRLADDGYAVRPADDGGYVVVDWSEPRERVTP